MTAAYLDASAIVKLILPEAESEPLVRWLAGARSRWSSSLVLTEVPQAVRRGAVARLHAVPGVLAGLDLLAVTDPLLEVAGTLAGGLRTLDAIHVASALELGDDLGALVTYDRRMADAAGALGLPVAAPA